MGIRAKFLLYIILPLLVAGAVAAFYTSSKNFSMLQASTKRAFVLDTELAAAKISTENIRAIAVAKSAAVSAEVLFGNRPSSIKMIRQILESFPMYSGASIAYSINADFNDFRADLGLKNIRDGKDVLSDGAIDSYDFASNKTSSTVDDWIAASGGGRFAAYIARVDGDLVLSPMSETDIGAGFSALRKRIDSGEKDLFSVGEPYIGESKTMSVEYSAAIMSDSRFAGEVSFVSDFARIQAVFSTLKISGGEEYFLISPQNRIIASSRFENIKSVLITDYYLDSAGNFVQNFLKEENGFLLRDESSKVDLAKYNGFYSAILQYAVNSAKNSAALTAEASEKNVSTFRSSRSAQRYYVDVSQVKASKWLVVHIRPEIDFISAAAASLAGNLAMIFVILTGALIGLFVFTGFTRRVNTCRKAADALASGTFAEIPASSFGDEETGKLMRSMSKAIKSVSGVIGETKRAKAALEKTAKGIAETLGNYAFQSNAAETLVGKMSAAAAAMTETRKSQTGELEKLEASVAESLRAGENSRREIVYIDELAGVFTGNASASARRNAALKDKMRSISAVSADIEKVADESNLLSLNASIEAEKSGRGGGTFAVVAREISRMSENISASSVAMKNIVADMESAMGNDSSESGRLLETLGDFSQKYVKISAGLDCIVEGMKNALPAASSAAEHSRGETADIDKAGDMLAELAELLKKLSDLRNELNDASELLSGEVAKMGKSDFLK